MLSHEEESGREADEWREARWEDGPHCPVTLMRKKGRGGHSSHRDAERKQKNTTNCWAADERGSATHDRQDETEGNWTRGRRSKVVRGKGLRKWKRKKGREKSEENGNRVGGQLCWEDWIRGEEEENRKRVIMLLSSLFPVSLKWVILIGWLRGWGGVYIMAHSSGKRQLCIWGSCFDKERLGAEETGIHRLQCVVLKFKGSQTLHEICIYEKEIGPF